MWVYIKATCKDIILAIAIMRCIISNTDSNAKFIQKK